LNPVILVGVVAINLALVAYTIAMVAARKRRRASRFVLGGFTAAVALDVIATGCMVAGSTKSWFTLHGLVGYVALLLMLAVLARLWALRRTGPDALIPPGLYAFLRGAYVLWLIAYAIGVALAASR
jgi:hypothetical protein